MKLTIGMIVKNESRYLERCLMALKPVLENVSSELVIVDTGSSDNTIEIAKQLTDKVYLSNWNDDFAEARNVTLKHAKGEWYFYIDADEILENAQEIINFFCKDTHTKYQAFAIKIENLVVEDRNCIGEVFYSKRIVKIDKNTKFIGRIHEYLPEKLPVFISETILVHYGYIKSDEKLVLYKYERNIYILNKEIVKDPENIVWLYHLTKTYNFHGDYLEGLKSIEKALQITVRRKIFPIWIYNLAIDTYNKNGRYYEAENTALQLLEETKKETTAHITIYFYLAQAQSMLRKEVEAIKNYTECLRLIEEEALNILPRDINSTGIDFGGNQFIYLQIAALYDRLSDYNNANLWTNKAYDLQKETGTSERLADILRYIVRLYIKHEKYELLIQLYQDTFIKNEDTRLFEEKVIIEEIEANIAMNVKHRSEIIDRFYGLDMDSDYVFLNQIRKTIDQEHTLTNKQIDKIYNLNFFGSFDAYGEIMYHLMKQGIEVERIMKSLDQNEINRYIKYIDDTFKDFPTVITSYFKKYMDKKDIDYIIFSKALKRVTLVREITDNEMYMELFSRYIEEGIFYVEAVYKEAIIHSENTYVLRNNEEVFFMYMRKANEYKKVDELKYLYYLKQAVNAYEYMHKGIRVLLEEVKSIKEENEQRTASDTKEMNRYKELFKQDIILLIEANRIGEAKSLVDEYLQIIPNDLEMLLLKSELQLKLM